MNYKKWCKNFFVMSSILLVSIACFNYLIDPAELYSNKRIDYAINNMLKGNDIENLNNVDERIFKKKFIEKSIKPADIIVLGSSRSMGINKKFFSEHYSFVNYSVSGAGINDDLALWFNYYNKYNNNPEKIIICLDPWILNTNNGENRWKSIEDDYYSSLKLLDIKDDELNDFYSNESLELKKIKELFSFSYFKASIKYLKNYDKMKVKIANNDNYGDVIQCDGSIKYGKRTESLSLEEINSKAQEYISGYNLYQLQNFYEIDLKRKEKLSKFIEFLKDSGTEIIFYLPPYHPVVYDFINKNEKYINVMISEDIFEEIAENNNIKVVGGYNPRDNNLNSNDFSDGMHMRSSGYNKVFKNM